MKESVDFLILDEFSGAGGAAMGLYRGFIERYPRLLIVGIDNKPQPRYPAFHHAPYAKHFTFVQGDALNPPFDLREFDFIWASPPCQVNAKTKYLSGNHHRDLIPQTRALLLASGKPYIIENTNGARLHNPILLNGFYFGMNTARPRLFESNLPLAMPLLPGGQRPVKMGRPVREGDVIQVVGHFSGVQYACKVMGIDWMGQKELAQAIPPAYSEYIARQIRK